VFRRRPSRKQPCSSINERSAPSPCCAARTVVSEMPFFTLRLRDSMSDAARHAEDAQRHATMLQSSMLISQHLFFFAVASPRAAATLYATPVPARLRCPVAIAPFHLARCRAPAVSLAVSPQRGYAFFFFDIFTVFSRHAFFHEITISSLHTLSSSSAFSSALCARHTSARMFTCFALDAAARHFHASFHLLSERLLHI